MYPALSPPASKGFQLCLHAEEPQQLLLSSFLHKQLLPSRTQLLPTVINQIPAVDNWEQSSLLFPAAGRNRAALTPTNQERHGENNKNQPG